jgi:hypothetical protein
MLEKLEQRLYAILNKLVFEQINITKQCASGNWIDHKRNNAACKTKKQQRG